MFYPFLGAVSFIIAFVLLGATSIGVLLIRTEGYRYTRRRGTYLLIMGSIGTLALACTAYLVVVSMLNSY